MFWKKKNPKADSTQYIRRLIDLTTPNKRVGAELRSTMRYNRSLPAAIFPFERNKPKLTEMRLGVTSDLSDFGIGLNILGTPSEGEIVVAFFLPHVDSEHPWYFRCNVVNCHRAVGDIYHLGCEVLDFLTLSEPEAVSVLTPSILSVFSVAQTPATV